MSDLDAVRIVVSEAERAHGALEADRLDLALQAILDDGLVVLDDLVPIDVVETLADLMYGEVAAFVAAHDQGR